MLGDIGRNAFPCPRRLEEYVAGAGEHLQEQTHVVHDIFVCNDVRLFHRLLCGVLKAYQGLLWLLPNGDPNPNAISAAAYAWLGPFLGSISRPVGGWLADKYGGAAVTHWGTVIEVLSTVFAGIAIAKIQVSDTPEKYFPAFFLCFMLLFLSTGTSNGSTFRQISVIFNKEQTGSVLGWTSAVAAYGAALFPALFSAGYAGKFVPEMMYFLAAYYASCLLLNYWMYYRSNAEIHC